MKTEQSGNHESLLPITVKNSEKTSSSSFDLLLQHRMKNTGTDTPAAETRIERPRERRDPLYGETTRGDRRSDTKKAEDNHKNTKAEKTASDEKPETMDPPEEKAVEKDKSFTADEINKKDNDAGSLIKDKKNLKVFPETRPPGTIKKEKGTGEAELQQVEELITSLLQKEEILPTELKKLIEDAEKLMASLDEGTTSRRGKRLLNELRHLMLKTSPQNKNEGLPAKKVLNELAALLNEKIKPALKKNQNAETQRVAINQNPAVEKSDAPVNTFQMNNFSSDHGSDGGKENPASSFHDNVQKTTVLKGGHPASTAAAKKSFQQHFNEIVQQARVTVKDNSNGSFSLRLYPRHLGSVTVNLGLEQGILNGRFLVENTEARNLLMQNLDAVREHLEEAGIDIGEFQVNVRDQEHAPGEERREELHLPSFIGAKAVKEEASYDISAVTLHDGSINVII